MPWPSRSIALVYGTCLHAGLERWHSDRNLEGAINAARRELMSELGQMPIVKWDSRLKRGSKLSAITDADRAEEMLIQHLTAWHEARANSPFRVLSTEKTIHIELSRPDAWRIQCRLDAVVEDVTGAKILLDFKTAGKPWDEGKFKAHAEQLTLYLAAETRHTGRAPDYGEFHVFVKGTPEIQVFRQEFDIAAINRLIEFKVRPTIAMIEAEAFVANTNWWGHSPMWCPFWNHCPMGAAAEGGTPAKEAS